MTIFHKITNLEKFIILLIIPTYAKVFINIIAIEFHYIFDINATLLLFGSRVNNSANQYLDIDLAIESKEELDKGKLLKFKDFIDAKVNKSMMAYKLQYKNW